VIETKKSPAKKGILTGLKEERVRKKKKLPTPSTSDKSNCRAIFTLIL